MKFGETKNIHDKKEGAEYFKLEGKLGKSKDDRDSARTAYQQVNVIFFKAAKLQ